MLQSTSPPSPFSRASLFVNSPDEVEIMAIPKLLTTTGNLSLPTYTRRPGRLTR